MRPGLRMSLPRARMRAGVAVMIVSWVVLWSLEGSAATPTTALALEWSAPVGCPRAGQVRAMTAALLGRPLVADAAAATRVQARVRAVAGGYQLTIETRTSAGTDTRKLQDPRCVVLAESTAMITATAIDPSMIPPPTLPPVAPELVPAPGDGLASGTGSAGGLAPGAAPGTAPGSAELSSGTGSGAASGSAGDLSSGTARGDLSSGTARGAPGDMSSGTARGAPGDLSSGTARGAPGDLSSGTARGAAPGLVPPVESVARPPGPGTGGQPAPSVELSSETDTPMPAPAPSREPLRLALRLGGIFDLGSTPGPTGGLTIGVALLGRLWRAELFGMWLAPRTRRPDPAVDVGARVGLLAGGVRGCLAPRVRSLEIPVCAGLEAGAARGRGVGDLGRVGVDNLPWVAASVGPGLVWAPVSRLAVTLQVELVVPVTRTSFAVRGYGPPERGGEVYAGAPVAGRATLGLELRFR